MDDKPRLRRPMEWNLESESDGSLVHLQLARDLARYLDRHADHLRHRSSVDLDRASRTCQRGIRYLLDNGTEPHGSGCKFRRPIRDLEPLLTFERSLTYLDRHAIYRIASSWCDAALVYLQLARCLARSLVYDAHYRPHPHPGH